MTQDRTTKSRRGAIAGAIAALLIVLSAVAGPALADDFDIQRRAAEARAAAADSRAAELEESIEGLSAELGQAVLDLGATQARLPIAQAELAVAKADLERSQREAVLIAARLEDAKTQQASITTTITTDQVRGEEIRTAVAQMARRAYKGETAVTSLSVVMDATTTEDFVSQYGMVSTALRTQTKALDELDQIAATNRNSQSRLTAVKDKVAALKLEADQKVVEADAARAAAQVREDEIENLIAEQAARQAAIEAMKGQALAEQAAIDDSRAAIATELADIIAKQRAADEAARAAKAAAAAAAGTPAPPAVQAPTGNVSGALFGNPTATNPMYVTSEYGMRMHPILGYIRLHAGIDLRARCGTPLYAPRAGTVQWAQPRSGFGNQLMINYGSVNGNSLMTSLNHLTSFTVRSGESVSRGQLVGYAGNTGLSGACHLHFEVYVNGATVNPRPLLGL
ncbi:peptidoglycan DD-metalloendopeptidase family protein [Pengzhenrongella phosphoraccumulans]|uniref:peptidoglycan DD-metalloendopeptidase family protein n=1 Tax=Pengzhenrongella phosphoraccumulans TaxID=3114394 RepID=UPI00388D4AFA